jgi:hypothetical protein
VLFKEKVRPTSDSNFIFSMTMKSAYKNKHNGDLGDYVSVTAGGVV